MCLRHPRTLVFLLLSLLCVSSSYAERFKYLSYNELHERLVNLADKYPALIRLYSAQDRFSLPHVGNCTDRRSENSANEELCTIWVVELSNFETLPNDPERPEMLISGEVHGDEVIGPHVTLAFLQYMVENYDTNVFVRRMVDTRLVTVVPMANAIGFYSNEREENQIDSGDSFDPNRDFGFNQDAKYCMLTVAGRALNELFRVHLFRLLITFHGGTNVIGYEWGDNSHCNGRDCKPAPDTKVMAALAERMKENAGPAGQYEDAYITGNMGKTVYPVNGGLEDWAYGASWAREATQCNPFTLGGYPAEKTRIDDTTKRCVTYLVETAKDKHPPEETLGDSTDMMRKGAPGDGHIPRNVRLLLTAIDSIEPYIFIDDIDQDGGGSVEVSWRISGAFQVDGTVLQWSNQDGEVAGISRVQGGVAGAPIVGGRGTVFSQELPESVFSNKEPLFVRVVSIVDRNFSTQPYGSSPDVSPQSHLMGSRASTKWSYTVGKRHVRGRIVFSSSTRMIERSATGSIRTAEYTNFTWGSRSRQPNADSDIELCHAIMGKFGMDGTDSCGALVVATGSGGRTSSGTGSILAAVGGVVAILGVGFALFIFIRLRRGRASKAGNAAFMIADEEDEEERRALSSAEENANDYIAPEEVITSSTVRPHGSEFL
ncbi:Zinc carboxypeptidase [Gracilaria domingensis]|nr:Zinc carboxypeptidase [Gracilaria domingensis]